MVKAEVAPPPQGGFNTFLPLRVWLLSASCFVNTYQEPPGLKTEPISQVHQSPKHHLSVF